MEAALAGNLNFNQDNERPEDLKVTRLKREVANGTYRVDTDRVADEILVKLGLMRRMRRELENPSDPSRSHGLRGL